MLILRLFAWLFGLVGVIGTLLPFIRYDDYWIRGWDYPRVQLAVILGTAIVLFLVSGDSTRRFVMAGACLLAFTYQVLRIIPYTELWSKQVPDVEEARKDPEKNLRLLMSNVLQKNDEYGKLFRIIEEQNPDLILTLESNSSWEEQLDKHLDEDYPHSVKVPLENRYGMHLYSRFPLRNDEVMHLISDSIPSIYTEVQLPNEKWVQLYCVHPTPPSPTEEEASTGRDAELALVGKMVDERGKSATIVAGDLNDVAWSRSTRLFQRLSGLLDPRRGRGFYATFHADYWFARWPLDHVFHSDEFRLVELERLPHIGSDHYPVLIELSFQPEDAGEVDAPEERAGDREKADSTIRHAREGKNDVLLVKEDEKE